MKYESLIKRACVEELNNVFGFKPFLKNVSVIDVVYLEYTGDDYNCLVTLEVNPKNNNSTVVYGFEVDGCKARYMSSSALNNREYYNFVTRMIYELSSRSIYYNRIKHFVDSMDYAQLVDERVHVLYKKMKKEFEREIFEQYGETDESLSRELVYDKCQEILYDYVYEDRPFVKGFISYALSDDVYNTLNNVQIKYNINYLSLRPCDTTREEFKITMFIEQEGRYFISSMYNDEYNEIVTYEFENYDSYIRAVCHEYELWSKAEKIKTIKVEGDNLEIVFKED